MQNQPEDVMDRTCENNATARPASAPGHEMPAGRGFLDDPRRKAPVLALILSGMPGLGQIYVGYYQQGFANIIIVASIIALLASGRAEGAEPLLGVFLAFYWLYNMVDAWRRAVFYNNALAGIGPAAMPDDFTLAKGHGSLAGGLALILVGGVLLSNTLFGLSLEWVERWWPVAVIAVGAWLVVPAIRRRAN